MWRMIQQSDENIRAFVARLTSTADMCKISVLCECTREVSYRDNVIMHLIIHGMEDIIDIRIRFMSRKTSAELPTLDKLVKYIGDEEAGKKKIILISEDYQLRGVRKKSYYSKDKLTCSYKRPQY